MKAAAEVKSIKSNRMIRAKTMNVLKTGFRDTKKICWFVVFLVTEKAIFVVLKTIQEFEKKEDDDELKKR
jgi:hypothetical protein